MSVFKDRGCVDTNLNIWYPPGACWHCYLVVFFNDSLHWCMLDIAISSLEWYVCIHIHAHMRMRMRIRVRCLFISLAICLHYFCILCIAWIFHNVVCLQILECWNSSKPQLLWAELSFLSITMPTNRRFVYKLRKSWVISSILTKATLKLSINTVKRSRSIIKLQSTLSLVTIFLHP